MTLQDRRTRGDLIQGLDRVEREEEIELYDLNFNRDAFKS